MFLWDWDCYRPYPHFIVRETKALRGTQLKRGGIRTSQRPIPIAALILRQLRAISGNYLTHRRMSVPVQSLHCWLRCTHRSLHQTKRPFQYPSAHWQILWSKKIEAFLVTIKQDLVDSNDSTICSAVFIQKNSVKKIK